MVGRPFFSFGIRPIFTNSLLVFGSVGHIIRIDLVIFPGNYRGHYLTTHTHTYNALWIREIPQNLHTFALVDPPQNRSHFMTPAVCFDTSSQLAIFPLSCSFSDGKKQRRKLRSSDFSRIFDSWNLMFDLIDPSGQIMIFHLHLDFPEILVMVQKSGEKSHLGWC